MSGSESPPVVNGAVLLSFVGEIDGEMKVRYYGTWVEPLLNRWSSTGRCIEFYFASTTHDEPTIRSPHASQRLAQTLWPNTSRVGLERAGDGVRHITIRRSIVFSPVGSIDSSNRMMRLLAARLTSLRWLIALSS